MFYSQIILQKKGPLGKVWLAAHWGDSKLRRPQIFATDISASVDCIVHPQVPLALRVSGHLLLGVVRIYSRKVKYLMNDASEAMVKIKLAFKQQDGAGGIGGKGGTSAIDLSGKSSGGGAAGGGQGGAGDNLDVAHFGEFLVVDAAGRTSTGATLPAAAAAAFEIPFDLREGDGGNGGGGGFAGALLLGDEDDWVPAELEEDDGGGNGADGNRATQQNALQRMMHWTQPSQQDTQEAAVDQDLTLDTDMSMGSAVTGGGTGARNSKSRRGLSMDVDEDEGWTAFDPDAEDEEEEEEGGSKNKKQDESHVSDIEIARAANNDSSVLSDDNSKLRRMTLEGKDGKPISPVAQAQEDDDDGAMMPFDDDYDQPPPPDDSSGSDMHLSGEQRRDSMSAAGASIGGLDISNETPHSSTLRRSEGAGAAPAERQGEVTADDEEGAGAKRKRKSTTRRKRRKLRKVVIDNDNTELSKAHIKHMLANTENIIHGQIHPATWVPGVTDTEEKPTEEDMLREYLGYDKLLARPALGDDGYLHPKLLKLWKKNASLVVGKPFPYKMRDKEAEETAVPAEMDGEEDGTAAEDVEKARREGGADGSVATGDGDRRASMGAEEEYDDDAMMPLSDDEDEDPPMPMNDDEEEEGDATKQPPMDDSGFAQDMLGMAKSPGADGASEESGAISLGLVNDFGEDVVEGEDRQEAGDELVSSHSKWHKHTVKVLNMLQNNMTSNVEEDPEKAPQLSYNKISQGVSRRTAAGVFFELLQLKTWDFIELNQDGAFGDITISPGAKFNERPPSS